MAGSNCRPLGPKPSALPTELIPGALVALPFEHLLAWIFGIQQAYNNDSNNDYIKKGAKEE